MATPSSPRLHALQEHPQSCPRQSSAHAAESARPTGSVLDDAERAAVADLAVRHDVVVEHRSLCRYVWWVDVAWAGSRRAGAALRVDGSGLCGGLRASA